MRLLKILPVAVLLFAVTYDASTAQAKSNKVRSAQPEPMAVAAAGAQDDFTRALTEVLFNGAVTAVDQLGKTDGYFKNPRVKIPMPKSLAPVEKGLRVIGQSQFADDFVQAMNRAAEKAVPEAIDIFKHAIRQMTFTDAKNIVRGPDDAATQFFRRTSETRLREKFLPIVERFTEQVGVTAQYKQMMRQAGPVAHLVGQDAVDIDGYITQKALDGLFMLMADEERRIRRDPLARTTEILRKVFGFGR